MSVNAVLEGGWRVTKRIGRAMLVLQVLATAPGLACLALGYLSLESGSATEIDIERYFWTTSSALLGYVAFQSLFEPITVAVMYDAAGRAARDEPWSLQGSLKWLFRHFWRIFIVGIYYYGALYTLLILAFAGVSAVVSAGFVMALGDIALGLGLIFVGLIVFVLALAAGLVVALRYGLALPYVITFPQSGPSPFRASRSLMRGRYLHAAILVLILWVMKSGVGIVASVFVPPPALGAMEPEALFAAMPELVRRQLLQQTIGQFLQAVFIIYMSACWMVFFVDVQRASTGAPEE